MAILEAVAVAAAPQGVSQISAALALPLATTHRQLQKLVEAGLLRQDATTSLYSLGERSFRLAHAIGKQRGLARGREILAEINRTTTFSTLLGKLTGDHFIYLENIASTGSLSVRGEIGASSPLHATAIGKAMLSTLTLPEYADLVDRLTLDAHTAETITDRARLDEEIALVRERGYARSHAEYEPQIGSIAVPIRVDTGERTGTFAICIATHVSEMDQLLPWIDELRRAAERLEGVL